MAGYWKCSNKTPTPICIGLVDAVLSPKILDNILGILLFIFFLSEKRLQLRKTEKHLLRKVFGSPHTRNRICSLWNCFSNYVYLRDMYITLKGIGKILFASVLRILLLCKFLNFTTVFIKRNFKLSKVYIQFSM